LAIERKRLIEEMERERKARVALECEDYDAEEHGEVGSSAGELFD
jgi:hypothetical protein